MTGYRLAFLLPLFIVGPVWGQQVPGTADPGRIEERFEPAETPASRPEIVIPDVPGADLSTDLGAVQFTLTDITLVGVSAYQQPELRFLFENLIGQTVSLSDIIKVRDKLTAKYRQDGFVLSQAIIPPQTITNGTVEVRIIEGFVHDVRIEGNSRDYRDLVLSIAAPVKDVRPLHVADLERRVLLIDDLPGVSARSILQPSRTQTGAADLVLVIDRDVVSAFLGVDNRGSQAIGPVQAFAGVRFNSLFGMAEQTELVAALAGDGQELQYFAARQEHFLTDTGTGLTLNFSISDTESGGSLTSLDPEGDSLTWGIAVTHPLLRARSQTLNMSLGFDYRDTETDFLGTNFSKDHVRTVFAELLIEQSDTLFGGSRPAYSELSLGVTHGLKIFNATETGSANLSRAAGHSDFTRANLEFTRTQSLFDGFSVFLAGAGQVSSDPLLSSEEFGLGGRRFGRGFEPSELTGDHALAGSIEARYDASFLNFMPRPPQVYAFYDYGAVWNEDHVLGQSQRRSLASTGGGIRLGLLEEISLAVELAKPLSRDVAARGNRDVRPLFNVLANF